MLAARTNVTGRPFLAAPCGFFLRLDTRSQPLIDPRLEGIRSDRETRASPKVMAAGRWRRLPAAFS